MRKERVLLTPEYAAMLLQHNYHKNRNLRYSVISQYAADITQGRWNEDVSEAHDALVVSEDGNLINGQHRCKAVILADKPIYTWICYDVPLSMYDFFDGGSKRSAADFVDIPNRTNAAALARIMCAVEDGSAPLASALQGKITNRLQATRTQIIRKMNDDNDRIQRYVRGGQRIGVYLFNRKTQASTALYLMDYVEHDDAIERFVYEASQMTTTSQPINALRAYMGRCISNKNFKADYKWGVSCVLCAYEAFRNDSEIQTFNKINVVFSKYDKLIFDKRKEKMEE